MPPSRWLTQISALLLLATIPLDVKGDTQLDAQRTGAWVTDIPFYRSGEGTNVVPVRIGSAFTQVNLTVSEYIQLLLGSRHGAVEVELSWRTVIHVRCALKNDKLICSYQCGLCSGRFRPVSGLCTR